MTRQLQMKVILSTLVLLLAVGWPVSLWSLGECLHFRGPLPNPWGWLTEPQRFGRIPVRTTGLTHAIDQPRQQRMSSAAAMILLNNFGGPLDAYWCVVKSVFTHCALPHTLTTAYRPTGGG